MLNKTNVCHPSFAASLQASMFLAASSESCYAVVENRDGDPIATIRWDAKIGMFRAWVGNRSVGLLLKFNVPGFDARARFAVSLAESDQRAIAKVWS